MVLMSLLIGFAHANPGSQEKESTENPSNESDNSAETEAPSSATPTTDAEAQESEESALENSSETETKQNTGAAKTEASDSHALEIPPADATVELSIDITPEGTEKTAPANSEETTEEDSIAEWLTNLAGHLEVGVQFHYLPVDDKVNGFESLSFEGTPQFALSRGKWGKVTSGLAYRVNSANSTEIRFTDDYIGPVFGFHSGPFTSDLIIAYYNHEVFLQQELERFSERNEVLYSYLDLGSSQGVMPKVEIGLDFGQTGILLSAARPFQIDGSRDQGELTDTWRATASLSWKTLLFGYQYNAYKGQEEHVLTIGSDLSLNF